MLKPRNTLVTVVEITEKEKKTASGIVLPGETSNEYRLCEVVAVGPGMKSYEAELSATADLQPGQRVIVKVNQQMQISRDIATLKSVGVKFTDADGRPVILVEQSQIVAFVEPDLKLAD